MPRPPRPCLIWIASGARKAPPSVSIDESVLGRADPEGEANGEAVVGSEAGFDAPNVPPFLPETKRIFDWISSSS